MGTFSRKKPTAYLTVIFIKDKDIYIYTHTHTHTHRVIRNDCRGFNNCHLVLQMQPHGISFYGVTSRIKFMFLLFPQVSRN